MKDFTAHVDDINLEQRRLDVGTDLGDPNDYNVPTLGKFWWKH